MTSLRPENFPLQRRPRQRRQASPLRLARQGGLQATLTQDRSNCSISKESRFAAALSGRSGESLQKGSVGTSGSVAGEGIPLSFVAVQPAATPPSPPPKTSYVSRKTSRPLPLPPPQITAATVPAYRHRIRPGLADACGSPAPSIREVRLMPEIVETPSIALRNELRSPSMKLCLKDSGSHSRTTAPGPKTGAEDASAQAQPGFGPRPALAARPIATRLCRASG